MSTIITVCPKCGSKDFEVLNPDVVHTSKTITVQLHCKCNRCKTGLLFGRKATMFSITEATDEGRRRGVLY